MTRDRTYTNAELMLAELNTTYGTMANRYHPRFAIGTQYTTRGKHPKRCTVVDIHTTINATGEVVKVRYVVTHELLGQTVTDSDVVDATIARCLIEEGRELP